MNKQHYFTIATSVIETKEARTKKQTLAQLKKAKKLEAEIQAYLSRKLSSCNLECTNFTIELNPE